MAIRALGDIYHNMPVAITLTAGEWMEILRSRFENRTVSKEVFTRIADQLGHDATETSRFLFPEKRKSYP